MPLTTKILLHSATGNTRLIARSAALRLKHLGHECEVVDIVRRPEPPELDGVDLVGVACPTMYFRPTFAMEGYVARMPNAGAKRKPAFLLGTCSGEPGAHFQILGELLGHKGYVTLGAHWVIAPTSWPPHRHTVERAAWTAPLAKLLTMTRRDLRLVGGILWESPTVPDRRDKDDLLAFVDGVARRTETGGLDSAPTPKRLHRPLKGTDALGRCVPREFPDKVLHMHVDPALCSRCGTCVEVCSERIITRDGDHDLPRIGQGCTWCYACFNRCPEGALSDAITRPGVGRYKGPPPAMKELFRG